MNSTNTNYGICNSMGDNNIVYGNSCEDTIKDININGENIEILKELADKILVYRDTNIKSSEMIEAGSILNQIAESAEEDDKLNQKESIIKWKEFKNKVSPKVTDAINLASSGITIGTFLKALLGL